MTEKNMSRRKFVSSMAGAAVGVTIVPRHVLGGPGYRAPSDTVNLAVIGAGAQGMSNINGPVQAGHNLVAIADIDFEYVRQQLQGRRTNNNGEPNEQGEKLYQAYSNANWYTDFREMLERERTNIDGVIIATPDHGHAVQANAAMQLGLNVYVQKPLTWSVYEARVLADTARRTGVVTQMGNQGHSSSGTRRIREWIQAGVIGPVSEVYVWTNRPLWPQGIPRPTTQRLVSATQWPTYNTGGGGGGGGGSVDATFGNVRNVQQPLAAAMAANMGPPPEGLAWDIFLGPAPEVPYHPIYHPFNWRGWVDYGQGSLGDMGAHLIDQPFWALDLGLPTAIEATSTPFGMDIDNTPASWPQAVRVHYHFVARGENMPAVDMHWYDGGLMPPRPPFIPDDVTLIRGGGGVFVGTRGVIMYETYGNNPVIYPESLRSEADAVPETIRRIPDHIANWTDAIQGLAEPSSDFSYAARLTETMALGMVALRVGQGRKILYDAQNMSITNVPEANHLLHREYRSGWSL